MKSIVLCFILSLLLSGCGQPEEKAAMVTLYEYQGLRMAPFTDVTIYEKRTGYIKFKWGDRIIEHSGRYTIESFAK